MKKIFNNPKFGDKFKTSDGRLAIFWKEDEYAYICIVEGKETPWAYDCWGQEICLEHEELFIVSKFEE